MRILMTRHVKEPTDDADAVRMTMIAHRFVR